MRFKVRFNAPIISFPTWRAKLETRLGEQIERAGVAWLNATVLQIIPIWSGASRATFLKLARAVSFPLTITGIKDSAKGTIAAGKGGIRLGFQQSKGEVTKGKRLFTFTYGTTLFHLVFNEFNDANASPKAGRLFHRLLEPGPYNFQEVGRDAFEEYTRSNVKLPSPWQALKITRIQEG